MPSPHRSNLVDLTVIVRRETNLAWGVASEDKHGEIIWLPKSQVEIDDRDIPSGRATLTCPLWLAKDKGLV